VTGSRVWVEGTWDGKKGDSWTRGWEGQRGLEGVWGASTPSDPGLKGDAGWVYSKTRDRAIDAKHKRATSSVREKGESPVKEAGDKKFRHSPPWGRKSGPKRRNEGKQ